MGIERKIMLSVRVRRGEGGRGKGEGNIQMRVISVMIEYLEYTTCCRASEVSQNSHQVAHWMVCQMVRWGREGRWGGGEVGRWGGGEVGRWGGGEVGRWEVGRWGGGGLP